MVLTFEPITSGERFMNIEIFISQLLAFFLALLSYFLISNFIQPKIMKNITQNYLKNEFQQNIYLLENLIKINDEIKLIIATDSGYPSWLSSGDFLTTFTNQAYSNGLIYDRLGQPKELRRLQGILNRYHPGNSGIFNQAIQDYMKLMPEEKAKKKQSVLGIVAINKKWF